MTLVNRMFAVFEGPDYSGKSTLHKAVIAQLQNNGIDVVGTREPGGTPMAEDIRKILLDKSYEESITPETDILLHQAYRRQHVENLIKPSLAAGRWVLSDRFIYSTFALNIYPYMAENPQLNDLFMGTLSYVVGQDLPEPIVFFLDTPYEVLDARAEADPDKDRYESKGPAYQKEVREAYKQLHGSGNAYVLDGTLSVDQLATQVIDVLNAHHAKCLQEMEATAKASEALAEDKALSVDVDTSEEIQQVDGDLGTYNTEVAEAKPFVLEEAIQDYYKVNIEDLGPNLFPMYQGEELAGHLAIVKDQTTLLLTKLYKETGEDETIFQPHRVGNINQKLHSMFHYSAILKHSLATEL